MAKTAQQGLEQKERQRSARATAVGGSLLVLLYAVLGVLEIFVLGPLEGSPGRSLAQIYADLAAAGELAHTVAVSAAVIATGLLVAAGVAVVTFVHRRMTWLSVAFTYLGLLVMGAPAFAVASFAPGMSLSDVYGSSGADFMTFASIALYGTSGAALLALLVLCAILVLDAVRSSSPDGGSPQRSTPVR